MFVVRVTESVAWSPELPSAAVTVIIVVAGVLSEYVLVVGRFVNVGATS